MIEQLKKLLAEHGIMKSHAAKQIGVVPTTMTNLSISIYNRNRSNPPCCKPC